MTAIIDASTDVTAHLAALAAAGVQTVFGYLDPIGPQNPKAVTPARARAIAAAKLRLGLVSEGWGDFAHGGISAGAGERDGAFAARTAPTLGAPPGACIYFAVDVDANAAQIDKLVLPYFAAVRAALPGIYRAGVYGSGNVCAAVLAAGSADLAWLSCATGWGGSQEFQASNKWTLAQHAPTQIAGVACDADDANTNASDIGDFVPFAPPPPPLAVPAPGPIARALETVEKII